jgi:hypothetical protein
LVAIGAAVFISSSFPIASHMPYLGNIMNANGIGALTIPGQEGKQIFLGESFWIFLTAVSIASASMISTELINRFRKSKRSSIEFFFLLVVASFLLLNFVKTGGFYDRYIMLFMPLLGFVFLKSIYKSKVAVWSTVAYVAFFLAFSIVGTLDYVSWNEARWSSIQNLIASGVDPNSISGGFEYCLFNHGMAFQYEYWMSAGVFDDEGVRPHDWRFCPDDEYVISFSQTPDDFVSAREYATHETVSYCSLGGLVCGEIFVLKAI